MSDFPTLKTGAVMQYPARKAVEYATHVGRFLDGATQRHREWASPLRQWIVRLTQLDDEEIRRLEDFFREQKGRFGSFTFTDPWDGTQYPDCSLGEDEFDWELAGEGSSRTTLIVRQNRV